MLFFAQFYQYLELRYYGVGNALEDCFLSDLSYNTRLGVIHIIKYLISYLIDCCAALYVLDAVAVS